MRHKSVKKGMGLPPTHSCIVSGSIKRASVAAHLDTCSLFDFGVSFSACEMFRSPEVTCEAFLLRESMFVFSCEAAASRLANGGSTGTPPHFFTFSMWFVVSVTAATLLF